MLPPTGQTAASRPGRTVTALDDALTRTFGRLPMSAALLLGAAVYAAIGLALPLATDAPTLGLIAYNALGAATGWAITLAWLFPLVESSHRRHLLEWTTNLRQLSATEFERLVGELLRREGCDVEETGSRSASSAARCCGRDCRVTRASL